jgi:hypothetical protein
MASTSQETEYRAETIRAVADGPRVDRRPIRAHWVYPNEELATLSLRLPEPDKSRQGQHIWRLQMSTASSTEILRLKRTIAMAMAMAEIAACLIAMAVAGAC